MECARLLALSVARKNERDNARLERLSSGFPAVDLFTDYLSILLFDHDLDLAPRLSPVSRLLSSRFFDGHPGHPGHLEQIAQMGYPGHPGQIA